MKQNGSHCKKSDHRMEAVETLNGMQQIGLHAVLR